MILDPNNLWAEDEIPELKWKTLDSSTNNQISLSKTLSFPNLLESPQALTKNSSLMKISMISVTKSLDIVCSASIKESKTCVFLGSFVLRKI